MKRMKLCAAALLTVGLVMSLLAAPAAAEEYDGCTPSAAGCIPVTSSPSVPLPDGVAAYDDDSDVSHDEPEIVPLHEFFAEGSTASTATSFGCTRSWKKPVGFVCLKIDGEARWVNYFRIARLTSAYDWNERFICRYQSRLTIHYPNGNTTRVWGPYHDGCTFNQAWQDYQWHALLPHNTRVCGSWWSNGRSRKGMSPDETACNYIYRS